ncbi:methyltransferase domain-containing protein [bacterium]|nr:methyltransferase domain-containing protein [bacterium]
MHEMKTGPEGRCSLRADFERFVEERASTYGFTEQTRSGWIKYMTQDVERGSALAKELLLHFALPKEKRKRALDVGCGFGGLAYALSQEFESAGGIELVEERVEWARRRFPGLEIVKGNATRLPWPDGHFDLMACNDVFEHVSYEDQKKAASEIFRVLKSGGVGYVAVPNRFQLRDDHNGIWLSTYFPHPIRGYVVKAMGGNRYLRCFEQTRGGWKKLFERTGFRVTMLPAAFYRNNRFFPPQHWKIYLHKP